MSDRTKAIGERIKELRKQKNLTQKEIAMKLGRTAAAVTQWELGITAPNGQNLIKLADLLGCDPQWILTGQHTQARDKISKWDGIDIPRSPIVEWQQVPGFYYDDRGISHIYTNEWMPVIDGGDDCVIVKTKESFFPGTDKLKVPEGSLLLIDIRSPFEEYEVIPGKYYVMQRKDILLPAIKQLDFDGLKLILKSVNPNHEDYHYNSDDWDIIGEIRQIIVNL